MANYIDLILCIDNIVLEAPKFSYISDGDIVMGADGVLHTVRDRITLTRDSEEYRFIAEIYGIPISCITAKYSKTQVTYPEEVTADVGNE